MLDALRGLLQISIHALREEGDHGHWAYVICWKIISIHALREEGDAVSRAVSGISFISIHALREEGDWMFDRISPVT